MPDSTEIKGVTRQTVDVPTELMEHYDAIKRRRKIRSFGAYVLSLIKSDKSGLNLPSADSQIKGGGDSIGPVTSMAASIELLDGAIRNLTQAVESVRAAAKEGSGDHAGGVAEIGSEHRRPGKKRA